MSDGSRAKKLKKDLSMSIDGPEDLEARLGPIQKKMEDIGYHDDVMDVIKDMSPEDQVAYVRNLIHFADTEGADLLTTELGNSRAAIEQNIKAYEVKHGLSGNLADVPEEKLREIIDGYLGALVRYEVSQGTSPGRARELVDGEESKVDGKVPERNKVKRQQELKERVQKVTGIEYGKLFQAIMQSGNVYQAIKNEGTLLYEAAGEVAKKSGALTAQREHLVGISHGLTSKNLELTEYMNRLTNDLAEKLGKTDARIVENLNDHEAAHAMYDQIIRAGATVEQIRQSGNGAYVTRGPKVRSMAAYKAKMKAAKPK
ncbi:MAG: hypothetical protein OXR66_02175 [Candidatus Woesearchaeota archaeon]|nr:hypothetical protein [Candidatus Woesearchaeota archaeon]